MTDIAGTLGSMFSLIIVTILGYVAARCGFISADIRPKLSGLIFNITLPCTILASVGKIDASTGAEAITWSLVFGIALFFVMLAGGALACLALRVPRGERGLYLWMGVLTNTGFIGFAVLDSIFGGASVFLGSIFIALSNVFIYSIGVALLRSAGQAGRAAGVGGDGASGEVARKRRRTIDVRGMLKDMVNVPLVMSLVAMVIFFAQVSVPAPIMQAADMTGGITAPLAMMLVGLSIADADLKSVLTEWRLWGFTIIRFLVAPLIAYLALAPIVPSELALGVFIVLLAVPTGSMAGPIAATYGQDGDIPARGTIVSTLASFAIVPILMLVMTMA